MEILDEIKERVEKDTRSPAELVNHVKNLGINMFVTGTISKESTISFCAAMLKLYFLTKERYNG